MITDQSDTLDSLAAKLPEDIQPQRDLWPGIAAQLPHRTGAAPGRSKWSALAAGLALVAITATVTWQFAATRITGTPVEILSTLTAYDLNQSPGTEDKLVAMRAQLMNTLNDNFSRLPPDSQRIVADNLLVIRNSLAEIGQALAEDPGNPLLQQLLYTTYEKELNVLSNMNRVALSFPAEVET